MLFDRYLQHADTDYVITDNKAGTHQATNMLAKNGYKKIAFITFANPQVQMRDRLQGYLDAIKQNNLEHFVAEVLFSRNDQDITKPILDFLNQHKQLDAVVFGTNHVGACGLKAIQQLGLKVPDDLAVISFDDYDVFQLHSPLLRLSRSPFNKLLIRLSIYC
ncbi:substrate-binding domain-containing protein [Mucilaginibacter antarcticus]|uniref:substrate-binding domain-containing protein n=1 Tax=Mucilaginibacter antarcticus TaxID=1855725 RepID=UPI00363F11EA